AGRGRRGPPQLDGEGPRRPAPDPSAPYARPRSGSASPPLWRIVGPTRRHKPKPSAHTPHEDGSRIDGRRRRIRGLARAEIDLAHRCDDRHGPPIDPRLLRRGGGNGAGPRWAASCTRPSLKKLAELPIYSRSRRHYSRIRSRNIM